MSLALYPIAVGNRWEYHRVLTIQSLDAAGNPTGAPLVIPSVVETEQIAGEMFAGRKYIVEQETTVQEGRHYRYWFRTRQDRSGLYGLDLLPGCDPPGPQGCTSESADLNAVESRSFSDATAWNSLAMQASSEDRAAIQSALLRLQSKRDRVLGFLRPSPGSSTALFRRPGGRADGEFQRLSYPLRPGAEWTLRPDEFPDWKWIVDAHEVLDLPAGRFPAYRLRTVASFLEPGDHVYLWFGRAGFLGFDVRIVSEARNESGEILGLLLGTETQTLEELDISGSHSFAP